MKYLIRDRSKSSCPILGTAELKPEATPSDLLMLANTGHLWLQPERTKEDLDSLEEERLKNEAAIADPEKHIAQVQAEIDRVASKLPDGEYGLIELTGRQLKALCESYGFPTTGNKFDLMDRIEKAIAEGKTVQPTVKKKTKK